ncbi:MAG: ABC transporter ATP-binding protein [Cyclobacteriaceae bacterium]
MSALIKTESLSVQYAEDGTAALQNINLSVAEGEILALVGESGSGKTTLLKTLAALLEPTKGTVHFDGKPLPPPSRRLVPGHPDIRMVFQDFSLSANMTVFENIWHVLRAYEREYRQERTEELLARCRLSGLEDHAIQTLSGGEKQRVALARALAEEPRLLLMDEPFGQLDSILKQQLKFELAEFLQESSSTVVMVTHEPKDALGIADTIAVLQNGELQQVASPKQVYEQPQTPYVAQLFGTVAIFPTDFWQNYQSQTKTTLGKLGIRAEQVQVVSSGKPELNGKGSESAVRLPGTVAYLNYQGHYQEVAVRLANEELLTAFYSGNGLAAGQTVELLINPADLIPLSE